MSRIVCFEHREHRVFSFCLPEKCPKCLIPLAQCTLDLPPFEVTSPFARRAADFPCSVVVRPTSGNFLQDYENGVNLHVGVTDSSGVVFDFSEDGIRKGNHQWTDCIVVPFNNSDPDWGEYWDCRLHAVALRQDSYDEENNNCFSFVLEFLVSLRHGPMSKYATSKLDFCREYILPATTLASKYIRLHRKIKDAKGVLVVENNDRAQLYCDNGAQS